MDQTEHSLEPRLRRVLTLLSDGELHSGQELGQLLGVSRTAVWKQLQKLGDWGVEVVSVKGRGYCLSGGLDLLERDGIEAAMDEKARALCSELALLAVVDSTNRYALERVPAPAAGFVCLAERQSAGRGRRGRDWVSPFGRNIYLSVVWDYEGGAQALEGLSLAVGVTVAEALEDVGVLGTQLKWPNDIYWQGRKLGGILLEMAGDPAGSCRVVVGLGLNMGMPETAAKGIDQPWADLHHIEPHLHRSALAGAILNRLLPRLAAFQVEGFGVYRERWHALDAFAGQEVTLRTPTQAVSGMACGVDAGGALVLNVDGERHSFYGGEISLRLAK
ncbi:bifunctional biotin--[acetyl-CoA-carboxylase] ligase/biotin operon repressor BirA [Marinimicrobium alkaliphilum]|uniref:bifunctional biotin--[acetyl-CoA-carboxylase] ligase/biotin operon repressor BirA n=1 Tax=Marinimicrobium alkaliphilum TaxID=2202654 RepID=UPI000DBA832B|nr:bifunctional biotin--[acetyl-CoA-carboxylase] ligase/biotin operon repressor BirA [Marinimicrobium alkaliphilum]